MSFASKARLNYCVITSCLISTFTCLFVEQGWMLSGKTLLYCLSQSFYESFASIVCLNYCSHSLFILIFYNYYFYIGWQDTTKSSVTTLPREFCHKKIIWLLHVTTTSTPLLLAMTMSINMKSFYWQIYQRGLKCQDNRGSGWRWLHVTGVASFDAARWPL